MMEYPRIVNVVTNGDPVLTKANADYWRLHEDLAVAIHTEKDGVIRINIRAGWTTDLLSVPRWLVPIFDDGTQGDKGIQLAGIVHDAIYGSHCFSKHVADELFRQMLIIGGMAPIKAWAYFHAVDLMGDNAWDEDADGVHDRAFIQGNLTDR